jgi:hypothetical protein
MPFIREMSREKIRFKEKFPPRKGPPGRKVPGKRGRAGSWTPVSGDRKYQDGYVRILTAMVIMQ